MNRLALGIALISRLNQETPHEERVLRETQTHSIPAGSNNRWELRRSAFPRPRQGFKRSPLLRGKDANERFVFGVEAGLSRLPPLRGGRTSTVAQGLNALRIMRRTLRRGDARGSPANNWPAGSSREARLRVCGHPEMRCLPDGVFHCPSCDSEVLPTDAHAALSEHSGAWWAGWMVAHFGERASFACNPNLAKWETPSERLAYYRGAPPCRQRNALGPG